MRLNEVEKAILKNRLDGVSFFEFNPDEIRHAIDQLMFKGAAISGCSLPITEFFAEYIAGELELFILEMGYGELTLSEILFALRMNVKGGNKFPSGEYAERIEFTGKFFNVAYIAKVLGVYKIFRECFDRKLQNFLDGLPI